MCKKEMRKRFIKDLFKDEVIEKVRDLGGKPKKILPILRKMKGRLSVELQKSEYTTVFNIKIGRRSLDDILAELKQTRPELFAQEEGDRNA